MVVAVEPAVKGAVAIAVGAIDAHSGPFIVERAVEPFDLAVGLRPVGPGARVGDAELGAEVAPGVAAVAGAVVGQDTFDRDAVEREPAVGAFEEPGATD